MSSSVCVRHNFETGHRLPHLPGKCQSLHGHSWWAEVTVEGPLVDGLVIDFGSLKAGLRTWIDTNLDHGLMLGAADPLLELLSAYGKTFEFTREHGLWPTVENVARLLAVVTDRLLREAGHAEVFVARVDVSETHVNRASWLSDRL